jgi:hypothetical protein
MSVLAYGFGQAHLAVLICADFVMVLLVMDREPLYLGFPFLAQYGAYRHKQFQDYILNQVMPLKEQICVIFPDTH